MAALREHGQAGQVMWQGTAGENHVPWWQSKMDETCHAAVKETLV